MPKRRDEELERGDPLPDLYSLHERHPGLTSSTCGTFAEAASVCLSRHHDPDVDLKVETGSTPVVRSVSWKVPDTRVAAAHANETDATCNGAYGVSLAALEVERGLVALGRASNGTGADWYVTPVRDAEDLEDALRLEVSGTDEGGRSAVMSRVRTKIEQAANGRSDKRALVSVVGFREKLIVIRPLNEAED